MLYIIFLFISISLLSFYIYKNSSYLNQIDIIGLEFFNSFQSKTLDSFFSLLTWLGSLWILTPLFLSFLFILFRNGYYLLCLYLGIGFIGAISTTYCLKYILSKKRPHIYQPIVELPQDPSFPSAHTTQVTIFALLLILVLYYFEITNKLLFATLLVLLILFVAISRIYLQVHYFSDVLAGLLIGLFWFMISFYLIRQKELL